MGKANSQKEANIEIDKIMLILNMIVYRVESLLGNISECLLIIIYTVICYSILENTLVYVNTPLILLVLPIVFHVSYSLTYIINDIIDYKKISETPFYRIRPIYYFRHSKFVIIYFICYFFAILLFTIIKLNFNSLLIVPFILIIEERRRKCRCLL